MEISLPAEFVCSEEQEIPGIIAQCLPLIQQHRIVTFEGNLGAGKTTFIKYLCSALKSTNHISSPTYSLINEYEAEGAKIFHMDLYRLKSMEEALDIGIEDYFYSNNYCFIEWPELITPLLPDNFLHIRIIAIDKQRKISIFRG
jgi:tRNA threonylcarbamoyladenosine biosynthesis protein TsaE